MANNPETYICRTTLKNCFSVISKCRRVAIKRLPVNFFVVMFNDLTHALLNNENSYADVVIQAWNFRKNPPYNIDPQFIDATMDIFDNTLKKFNINDPVVSKVYREFISGTSYVLYCIYYALNALKPM